MQARREAIKFFLAVFSFVHFFWTSKEMDKLAARTSKKVLIKDLNSSYQLAVKTFAFYLPTLITKSVLRVTDKSPTNSKDICTLKIKEGYLIISHHLK